MATVIPSRGRSVARRSVERPVAKRSAVGRPRSVEPKAPVRRRRARSRTGSNSHGDELMAQVEAEPGWFAGKTTFALPEDVGKLTDFVLKIKKLELDQFELILATFVKDENHKKSFNKVIEVRKWEMNPANVSKPVLSNPHETVDLAFLLAMFAEQFAETKENIDDIRKAAIHTYGISKVTERSKFKGIAADVDKLNEEFVVLFKQLKEKLNESGRRYLNSKQIKGFE
uniref:Uncharacterized protein n=1 Tax=Panagrolaimus sp. JU765 TaxID=591449 RepID=A0AC34R421_9BILA